MSELSRWQIWKKKLDGLGRGDYDGGFAAPWEVEQGCSTLGDGHRGFEPSEEFVFGVEAPVVDMGAWMLHAEFCGPGRVSAGR